MMFGWIMLFSSLVCLAAHFYQKRRWRPTIQKFTSGKGTWTVPVGIKFYPGPDGQWTKRMKAVRGGDKLYTRILIIPT